MHQNLLALLWKTTLLTSLLAIAASLPGVANAANPASTAASETVATEKPVEMLLADDHSGDDSDDSMNDMDDMDDMNDMNSDDDMDADASLPDAVATAVIESIAETENIEVSSLRILEAQQQTWPNGCLGLEAAGVGCTQATVPGWIVVATNSEQVWVYRTDATGSNVAYDEAVSQTVRTRIVRTTETRTSTSSSTSGSSTAVAGSSSSSSTTVSGSSSSTSGSMSSGSTTSSSSSSSATISASQLEAMASRISFSDVSSNYWARGFITRLAALEIIRGFPDGSYRPTEAVTRAQFAAMINKAFERTMVREAVSFSDVSSSYWAYSAIRRAYSMGFLNASGGSFNPTARLTRLDILVSLARGLGYTSVTTSRSVDSILSVYSDAASIPSEYRVLIAALTERGLMVNYPNTNRLELTRVATRSETAAYLYQSLVSINRVEAISSSYIVNSVSGSMTNTSTDMEMEMDDDMEMEMEMDDDMEMEGGKKKPNCNQGIGNGAEGCDPGNSAPRGGSNDETGRTPGSGKP